MRTRLGLLVIGSVAFIVSAANATVYYVDHEATGLGDGSSWPNPFTTVQAALTEATGGDDVINVADGTYYPSIPSGQNAKFAMESGLIILGGWAGVDDELADRDPVAYETILSGALSGSNAYVVVIADGVDEDALLEGFTIRDAASAGVAILGGASLAIRHCRFTSNDGHGVLCRASSPWFQDCEFSDNQTTLDGGGLLIEGGQPVVLQCQFIENHAAGSGGGMKITSSVSPSEASTPEIFNCEFLGNTCGHDGGGLYSRDNNSSNLVVLANCLFVGNHCEETGGGARVGFDSAMRFANCTFVENYTELSPGHGGGLSMGAAGASEVGRNVILDNCIFWGNTVTASGAHGSQIALNGNCGGNAQINYCNVQDSDSSEEGVYVGSTIGGTNCRAFVLTWGAGRLDVDPDFVDDPDLGNGDYGDLRLNNTSPLRNKTLCTALALDSIDYDNNEEYDEPFPVDLDELPRIVGRPDYGAYEQQDEPCVGNVDGDNAVGVGDLLTVIGQWGLTGVQSGDVNALPCGDQVVGVADLLVVIGNWGVCGFQSAVPESFYDCYDLCSSLSGEDRVKCMNACLQTLCQQGQTEFCDP